MEENKGKSRFLWMHKAMLIAFMDGLIVLSSYFMALLMRFDFIFSQIPQEYIAGYLWSMPFWITSTIVVFYVFRLYHSVWRLASISELQMCNKCICGIDYSIWIRYSVHAASHAEILLFHGIYSLFSLDHRTAFFLSDASVLCRTT